MNIEKRQNSYVIIGQNDEQLLISKGKYPESHSVFVHRLWIIVYDSSLII